MGRLLLTRAVQLPVVLLVISVLTFWLVQVVPGDPGRNALGPYATAEQVAQWNTRNGLDGPVAQRYLHWLGGFLTGDWGTSLRFSGPVRDLVMTRLGNSLALGLYAFALLVPLALVLGVVQARRRGQRVDRGLTIGLLTVSAVPEFVTGVLLLLVLAVKWPLFPVQSSPDAGSGPLEQVRLMTLPAVVLAVAHLAVLARMVRAGTIEAMAAPFHLTAVLKGLPPGRVVRSHVLRNALVPTLSVVGTYLGTLLGGAAVVETLFSYPGLGALLVAAADRKDVLLLTSGVVVTGLVSLLALLLTDLVFLLVDPRIRFGGRT
ncbi:ABC transporter permease [Kineococcus aurantiacus]